MSLPIELRYIIYAQAITPNLGYIDLLKENGRPDLSLMLVSKKVCEEARYVLYTDVHIELTFWDLKYRESAWRWACEPWSQDVYLSDGSLDMEKFRVARAERIESFRQLVSGDEERNYAIGLSPDFVSRFRSVSFAVPIRNNQFADGSYRRERFGVPTLPDREAVIFFEQWHCMPDWFEQFSAGRNGIKEEASGRSSPRVRLRWDYDEGDVALSFMKRRPFHVSRERSEKEFRGILCRWRDYLRGITYLEERFRTSCPEIEIISDNASKQHQLSITHEVVDGKITIGTMVEDATISSFKFVDLKLVDFHCKWR